MVEQTTTDIRDRSDSMENRENIERSQNEDAVDTEKQKSNDDENANCDNTPEANITSEKACDSTLTRQQAGSDEKKSGSHSHVAMGSDDSEAPQMTKVSLEDAELCCHGNQCFGESDRTYSLEQLVAETNELFKQMEGESFALNRATNSHPSVAISPSQLHDIMQQTELSSSPDSAKMEDNAAISLSTNIPRSMPIGIRRDRLDSFSFLRTHSASSGSDYEMTNRLQKPRNMAGSSESSQLSCSVESTGSQVNMLPIRPRMASLDSNLLKASNHDNYMNLHFHSHPCLGRASDMGALAEETPEKEAAARRRHVSGSKNYELMEFQDQKLSEPPIREAEYLVMSPKSKMSAGKVSSDGKNRKLGCVVPPPSDLWIKQEPGAKNLLKQRSKSPHRNNTKSLHESTFDDWPLLPFMPSSLKSKSVESSYTERPSTPEGSQTKQAASKKGKTKETKRKDSKAEKFNSLKKRPIFFRQDSSPSDGSGGCKMSVSFPPKKSPNRTRRAYSIDSGHHQQVYKKDSSIPYNRSHSAENRTVSPRRYSKKTSLFSRLSFRIRSRSNSIEDDSNQSRAAPTRKISAPASSFSSLSCSAPETNKRLGNSNLRRAMTFTGQSSSPFNKQSEYVDMNEIYLTQLPSTSLLQRAPTEDYYVDMGQNSLPRSRKPNRKPRQASMQSNSGSRRTHTQTESDSFVPAWLKTDIERRLQKGSYIILQLCVHKSVKVHVLIRYWCLYF